MTIFDIIKTELESRGYTAVEFLDDDYNVIDCEKDGKNVEFKFTVNNLLTFDLNKKIILNISDNNYITLEGV